MGLSLTPLTKTSRSLTPLTEQHRGHGVSVVNDYADTFGKLLSFLTNFKGTITRKKVFRCVYTSNSNNVKIGKIPYLKKKSGVHEVVDYTDTRFSSFLIEYLSENEKFLETFFAC